MTAQYGFELVAELDLAENSNARSIISPYQNRSRTAFAAK
jgi:hypothetical protein